MVTYLGSVVQLCCGDGATLQTNVTGGCGECSQCLGHTALAPPLMACAFLVYIAQDPGCPVGELSGAGPKWRALPRSTPLRFRFSGPPQRHRLSWACVLCPSQVRAARATRCLASTHSPGEVSLIASLGPATQFPGCTAASQGCRVSLLGS